MNFKFEDYLSLFKKKQKLLNNYQCGIERETLRIDKKGELSLKSHPISLGASLTHPYIKTDFGEAQIEWNTPPLTGFGKVQTFLKELMAFTTTKLNKELYWPYSMPCNLNKNIKIATYGSSDLGIEQEIYREGLAYRYGKNLQMISGIHFNFSFSQPFWEYLYKRVQPKETLKAFINYSYLKIIRNFLHEGWLLTYLFGATPAMHSSFITKAPKGFDLLNAETLIQKYATSIRMSKFGYYSRIQNQLALSFNSLDGYLNDLKKMTSTPLKKYQENQSGLNNFILQNPNEHYARIRPKCLPSHSLEKEGIEYLEVRSIDIDPFSPLGISEEKLSFLHLFLIYCLFSNNRLLNKETICNLTANQDLVALKGRQPALMLQGHSKRELKAWGEAVIKKMGKIANLLGEEKEELLSLQMQKLQCPDLTPSGKIIKELTNNQETLTSFSLHYAKKHQETLKNYPLKEKTVEKFEQHITSSLIEQQRLETKSKALTKGYEKLELSTQVLIKEALAQEISVEVLDWSDHLIKLSKGEKVEYIQQATKTSKDSYITSLLLGNKQITKDILKENGIHVPYGKVYTSLEKALLDYPLFKKRKVVIKPKSTNFGIGIFFVAPLKQKEYEKALKKAFALEESVIVEDFFEGEEYRFLVIGDKVEGILKREPANITGDGVHTIAELIKIKNDDPTFYRYSDIQLGPIEKNILKTQKLTSKSLLKKGRKIYLRQNSNVSTGGDPIDVTDKIAARYKSIALKAAQVLNAKICGIDLLINAQSDYSIIELNYNPTLFIHTFPYKGKGRNVAKAILKLLKF